MPAETPTPHTADPNDQEPLPTGAEVIPGESTAAETPEEAYEASAADRQLADSLKEIIQEIVAKKALIQFAEDGLSDNDLKKSEIDGFKSDMAGLIEKARKFTDLSEEADGRISALTDLSAKDPGNVDVKNSLNELEDVRRYASGDFSNQINSLLNIRVTISNHEAAFEAHAPKVGEKLRRQPHD